MTSPIRPASTWAPSGANSLRQLEHSLPSLSAHVGSCMRARGRLFSLRCGLEALHRFLAPRFVTTLVLASVVLVLSGTL